MTQSARIVLRCVSSANGNIIPKYQAKNCELATKIKTNMIEVHLWIIVIGSSSGSLQDTYSCWRTKIVNTIHKPAFVTTPKLDTEPSSTGHIRARARNEYTTKAWNDPVLSENWTRIRRYLNEVYSAA